MEHKYDFISAPLLAADVYKIERAPSTVVAFSLSLFFSQLITILFKTAPYGDVYKYYNVHVHRQIFRQLFVKFSFHYVTDW